jgi:ketosteroid isomerase-like protein
MARRPPRLPPPMAEFDDDERDAVLAANRAFYRAFSERDLEAMELVWAPSGAMVCLHPGHPPLHGRPDVMESWRAILDNPQSPKVRCIDEWVVGRAGLAIVVCREVLAEGQLMATNTFVRLSQRWYMVGHHAGPVPPIERTERPAAPRPTAANVQPPRDRRKLH